MRLVDLARTMGLPLEELIFVRDTCRLPFMSIDGKLFVEPGDVPAWRKRCEQILGEG
jgi:hypothetical protein